MIDFSLSEEERAVRDTIRQFIAAEVMPLEAQVLRNERTGLPPLEPGQLRNCSAAPRLRSFEGTDEIQRRTIARNLLKGHVQLGQLGG